MKQQARAYILAFSLILTAATILFLDGHGFMPIAYVCGLSFVAVFINLALLETADPPAPLDSLQQPYVSEAIVAQAMLSCHTLDEGAEQAPAKFGHTECAICFEELHTDCTVLPCFHQYHTACVEAWFAQKPICPICMQGVFQE